MTMFFKGCFLRGRHKSSVCGNGLMRPSAHRPLNLAGLYKDRQSEVIATVKYVEMYMVIYLKRFSMKHHV